MKAPEGQSWEFREQVLPPRIIYLLREEVISCKDLLLLFVIGALVRPEGEQAGIGCYASNDYLAKAVGCHKMHVSKRLTRLAKKGLIVVANLRGQRYLELEWSRTEEERVSLSGEYGDILRKAHQKLQVSLEKRNEGKRPNRSEGDNLKANPLSLEAYPPLSLEAYPPLSLEAYPPLSLEAYHKVYCINNKSKETEGGDPSATRNGSSPHLKKVSPQNKTAPKNINQELPSFCADWCKQLVFILKKNPRRPIEVESPIRRKERLLDLWKRMGGDEGAVQVIQARLDQFGRLIGKIKAPKISSVKQFCAPKTFNWLCDAMDNLEPQEEDSELERRWSAAQAVMDQTDNFTINRKGQLFYREKSDGGTERKKLIKDEEFWQYEYNIPRQILSYRYWLRKKSKQGKEGD